MTGPLEIAANAAATAAILLAGRNSIHTWWTGIIGCTLFGVLFFQSKLYADVVLQVFFVLSSIVGWRQWLRGNGGLGLAIAPADFRSLAWTIPAGLAATAGYGALLHFWTDAYAPFADSAVLVFSVIAQLLLMGRRIENWLFWLAVNSIAVPLYASRGLYLTAGLYGVYWVNAVVSWIWWRRFALQQDGGLVRA
jgi:nicotinamide mononucleotide transporter